MFQPKFVKYNATVEISGLVNNSVHNVGDDFIITVKTNSTSPVVVTVNGDVYEVSPRGKVLIDTYDLAAGHYIVTAVVYENDKYTNASTTVEFDIVKYNATIEIIDVADGSVFNAGSVFSITIKTNSSGVVNVTVNGKVYEVSPRGKVLIDTYDLG